ncbi:hypothetical protein J2S17_002834 [Cytobacillus purgationiresistens]|uniref:Transposase n=2 Tax=Cytobacillus purgationiresistens TaxID=863449 RepID=A0ABU0AKP0_9BACI|nr:hypothetical protein [Cytobacillus purgationiresistens]
MKFFLILSVIILPIGLYQLQKRWKNIKLIFNVLSVASVMIFGSIVSITIYEILKDQTVFMTNVHAVFLNPLFLFTGAYLGIFFTYRLIYLLLEQK